MVIKIFKRYLRILKINAIYLLLVLAFYSIGIPQTYICPSCPSLSFRPFDHKIGYFFILIGIIMNIILWIYYKKVVHRQEKIFEYLKANPGTIQEKIYKDFKKKKDASWKEVYKTAIVNHLKSLEKRGLIYSKKVKNETKNIFNKKYYLTNKAKKNGFSY